MFGASLMNTGKDRPLRVIVLGVLAAHVLLLLALTLQPAHRPTNANARRVVVKTITLQPSPSSKPAKSSSAPPSTKTPPKPPQAAETRSVKKEAAKAPPKAKKDEKAFASREAINKIQDHLNKISTKPLASVPAVDIQEPARLEVDKLPDNNEVYADGAEAHYRDELARRLKMFLVLPERGEVIVKLTLNRVGAVIKMSVVSTASAANKKYIEQSVPSLQFSGFGTFFGGEQQHTFTIALRGD